MEYMHVEKSEYAIMQCQQSIESQILLIAAVLGRWIDMRGHRRRETWAAYDDS